MDRNNVYIGQDATIEFIYSHNVYQFNKVQYYMSAQDAINNTNLIFETNIFTNPSNGVYSTILPRDYIKQEGVMFDKTYFIAENGESEQTAINSFFLRKLPEIIPGNAINIEYQDCNTFKNNNGSIVFNDYSKDLLIYSDFDINTQAKYAVINTNTDITGTPVITSGGVFGNYVNLQNSSIKYNETNFNNNTTQGTIETRLRLGFDNGYIYQEFLSTPITGNDLLSREQKPNGALFYSAFNNSLNANWGNGSLTATQFNSAAYLPAGGKFSGCLDLAHSDNRYIRYNSLNNISLLKGSISFWYKANYSGAPTNDQQIVKIFNGSTNHNALYITHLTSGQLNIEIRNNTATAIINNDFGNFAPNLGQLYHIELNFDIENGETRLFLDGIQIGSTITSIGIRTNTLAFIQLGSELIANNFYIDELLITSEIQHISNFIPSNVENNQTAPYADNYTFKLRVGGILLNGGADLSITINPTDTFQDISNSIGAVITNAVTSVINNRIRITASNLNQEISIETPTSGNSLLDVLGGIDDMVIPNGPVNDNIFIQFYNELDNNSRITLTHSTIGEILVRMWDSTGTLKLSENLGIWSSVSNIWYNLSFCFNENIAQLFIDGVQFGKTINTGFQRNTLTKAIIQSNTSDSYGFDEFKIYNSYKYNKNYSVYNFALTRYPQNNPYFNLIWGNGIKVPNGIQIDYSGTIRMIPYIGNIGYYYIAGNWLESDGTYTQASTVSDFEGNYSFLPFDPLDTFRIKIFFNSDGITPTILNKFYLNFQPSLKPDYSPVINFTRMKLGEPTLPVEITNEQIELCLQEALSKWEYYRYHKEDVTTIMLEGNNKDGYKIPVGWENFYDVIFTPRSPISAMTYSSDWSRNIFLQSYYSMINTMGSGFNSMQTDFYLLLSNLSDMSITFGLTPTYRVMNNKLFVYPDPGAGVKIGLIKPRVPSVDEVNNDIWIRKFTLALSKQALGQIRETIGTVQAGMENIPLNGTQLKAEGKQEELELLAEFKSMQEPLFIYFI